MQKPCHRSRKGMHQKAKKAQKMQRFRLHRRKGMHQELKRGRNDAKEPPPKQQRNASKSHQKQNSEATKNESPKPQY